jgi:hypothetical protein
MFPCTADWRLEQVDNFAFDYFLDVNPRQPHFPDRCSMLPLACSPPQGALLADGLSPPFELGALLWP